MSARRVGNSVSLFPFLAVLVCAMGALIFLLLVVTRQIRAEARAAAIQDARQQSVVEVPPPSSRAPEPPRPPRESAAEAEPDLPLPVLDDVAVVEVDWSRMLDSLAARRRDGERALSEAADAVRLVETRVLEAERELARLRQDETDFASQRAELASRLGRLRDRAKKLNGELGRQRRAIRERTAEIESAESQFAFLPFDGVTGTHRRPIFIECHSDRIEFASEKIDLTAGDLVGSTRRANPLLAGVRALVDHWSNRDTNAAADPDADPDTRKPYVLMVVRPGGIHAYYLARKLLSQLEAPVGYELVPEQMPLAWPARDQAAAAACRKAIDQAVARRPRSGSSVAGLGRGSGFGGAGLPKPSGRPAVGPGGTATGGAGRVKRPSGSGAVVGRGPGKHDTRTARVIPEAGTGRSVGSRRVDEAGQAGESTGDERADGRADGVADGVAERHGAGEATGVTADAGVNTATAKPGGATGRGSGSPTFESLTVGASSPGGSAGGSGQGGDQAPRRWGVASLGATIGYERRVRVRIDPDRITVAEQPGIDIEIDGGGELTIAEIRQRVIRAVQLTARSWGPPPERFYWVPAIRFEVTPGGFLYYERLNSLFRSWRLSTSVDHVLPAASQPPVRLMQGLFEEPVP